MTRLYQDHSAAGFGQGATRDFALPPVDDGPVRLPTAAKGRTCAVCGCLLSVYNPDELCCACEKRSDEPSRPEDWRRLFEAVAGALTEPLDPWELPAALPVREPSAPTPDFAPRRRCTYSVAEAAQLLGLSPRTIVRRCRSGHYSLTSPHVPGAHYRIPAHQVEAELRQVHHA